MEKDTIIKINDPDYPAALKEIYDPPALLYVRGRLPDPARVRIAIVGSRKVSFYGTRMARSIAEELSRAGLVVVSGMALGIDTAAHEGALAGGGPTVAVLAGGLNHIYPKENLKLAKRIVETGGALITENPPEMEPLAGLFPQRNRIISGLSRGALVVEAAKKSGALITADCALSQGRDVFAVPGNADSRLSGGTNWLIKEGAIPVGSAAEILEEWGLAQPAGCEAPGRPEGLKPLEKRLLKAVEAEPVAVDDLIERAGGPAREVLAVLSQLEIRGLLKQLPGKRYSKTK
ncbi:MAG: DNA protecting protein DprA [Omnitrophica bacterium RIFCSPHIGHO2_02_FULL_63_14]|nr:MAG: DNA protecting protein DprA [Omnitrophica bacterium RIFCSPHIGHO2_02_FULL_63_14]